jgi:hypothetical protein
VFACRRLTFFLFFGEHNENYGAVAPAIWPLSVRVLLTQLDQFLAIRQVSMRVLCNGFVFGFVLVYFL